MTALTPKQAAIDAALIVLEQTLFEVQLAQGVGAEWYTRGDNGLYQHVRRHVLLGREAVQAARQANFKDEVAA